MIFVVSDPGPFSVSVFFLGKNLPTKIRLRKHSNPETPSSGRKLVIDHHGVEISMSVLILMMSWYKLVTMSDPKQSLDLRRLNEASSLFSYRVIQSNSLVEAIEYELSLYSYC